MVPTDFNQGGYRRNSHALVHSLEPLPFDKFEKFLVYIQCEERGADGNLKVYWREDRKQPITFLPEGHVPVTHIVIQLKILGMTVKQYLAILDHLFPEN